MLKISITLNYMIIRIMTGGGVKATQSVKSTNPCPSVIQTKEARARAQF